MNIKLIDKNLTKAERGDIIKLLNRSNDNIVDDLEQIWYLMDLSWDDCGCDSKRLNQHKMSRFYSHPVWLLNGLYIEQDDVAMGHRHAISNWIVKNNFEKIVDYGGGLGTLARLIAQKDPNVKVDIYEPHPSRLGLERAKDYKHINIIKSLGSKYDCLISTDVLEHVSDPLKNFAEMIDSVRIDGYLVVANAFHPVIKCHLPQNFHFRYSFKLFAKIMGLEVVGILNGSHATIFKKNKNKEVRWSVIRLYEKISRLLFPIIKVLEPTLASLKRLVIK